MRNKNQCHCKWYKPFLELLNQETIVAGNVAVGGEQASMGVCVCACMCVSCVCAQACTFMHMYTLCEKKEPMSLQVVQALSV